MRRPTTAPTPLLLAAVLLGAAALASACAGGPEEEGARWPPGGDAYAFDRPDARFELPARLREVSGLTLLDDRHLGAVQDEDGELFVIDYATGEVVRELRFARPGDYEGIERVEDRVFVLRSDGELFSLRGWEGDTLQVASGATGLRGSCDAEGLAYQPAEQRLLVACKERAGEGLDAFKGIYAYDLAGGRLSGEPVYLIEIAGFNRSVEDEHMVDRRLRSALSSTVDLSGFKPSALAVHPLTGETYVLSSVRKAVVVLGPEGVVTGVWALPDELFRQPEGLAFLPSGDLFIASEGGTGGRGTLLRFDYRN